MAQELWNRVWQLLIKLNMCVPNEPRIALSRAFIPEEGKLGFTENQYKNIPSNFICKSPTGHSLDVLGEVNG